MKFLIKLILGLGLLGVIAAGIVVIVLVNLDPNDYTDTITRKVKEATGRDLRIAGNVGLTFYPWLGIDLEGMSLSNTADFSDTPFLQAKAIKMRAKLLPLLLQNKLEMDTLILHGVTINLAKNASGATNWDDFVKTKTNDGASGDQAMPSTALVLGGIDIKDMNIHWVDKQQNVEYSISNANIGTGELKLGEPITITATLNASASKPALSTVIKFTGTAAYADSGNVLALQPVLFEANVKGKEIPGGQTVVKLSTEINVDFNNDTAQIKALKLNAFDTNVAGRIEAARILSGKPQITGNLDVNAADLPQLFKILEIEPLAGQLATIPDKTLKLSVTFSTDMDSNDLTISKLDINALGNKINTEIVARDIKSATPAATGKLNASGSDLPTLIKIAAQFVGNDKQDLNVLSRQLKSAPKSFDIKTEFDADLKTGAVDIPHLSIKVLGMVASARLNAKQVRRDTPALSGEMKVNGADLPLLMQVVSTFQPEDSALPTLAQELGRLKDKQFNVDTRFSIDMQSGRIDVPALTAKALGFKISGSLQGNNSHKNSGKMEGKFALVGKTPKPLLRALGQAPLAEVLQSINLDASIRGNTNNLNLQPLSLDVVFAGKKIPNSPVKLSVKADSDIDLKRETLALNSLSVAGLGLDLKGALKVTHFKTEPTISGEINLAPFDLRQFMKTLNQPLPKTTDPDVLKRVALAASFTGSTASLSVTRLRAELDKTKLQGDINLKRFSPLDLEFGLDVDKLNADHYLPPAADKTKVATPEMATAGVATKIPLETLQNIKIKGDFVMSEFIISNAKLTDLALGMRADNGTIKLAPVAAKLYGGTYAGDINLDATGKEPALAINSRLTGVQIEPLLADVTSTTLLSGEANIKLALTSSGADTNVLKSRLSGSGDIVFNNGILKGVDIGKVLRQLELMIESKRFSAFDIKGDTLFNALTATLNINNGIVENNDLLLSASGFKVTGDGHLINLNDQTWQYNLNVAADSANVVADGNRYNLGGYSLPIKCRGLVADMKCLPDASEIAKEVLKGIVQDKVQDLIGDKLDKLGIKIPGLKKKSAPAQEPAPEQPGQPATEPVPEQPEQPADPVDDLINKGAKKLLDKLF